MKTNLITMLIVLLVTLAACQEEKKEVSSSPEQPGVHKVVIEEVFQGSTYSYVKATENDEEFWLATSRAEINEGDTYYYAGGLEMVNFESKELNKTFDKIVFIETLSSEPVSPATPMASSGHGKLAADAKADIKVDPAKGGITIAELYKNSSGYEGDEVLIRGKVVKFNPQIMGKNWVHIQDGTKDSDQFDLTVTTQESAALGQVVTFKGKITLNKDFGAGYKYNVIMEEAKIVK